MISSHSCAFDLPGSDGELHLEAGVVFERDSFVYFEGDEATHWHLVLSGVLRTCRYLPGGCRQVTGFYFPGDALGVWSSQRRANAECVTRARVTSHPHSSLPRAVLERSLVGADERIELLGLRTAVQRVAEFLLSLKRRMPADTSIWLPMSRADVGDYLALTPETVSRSLSQLESGGLIRRIDPQHVTVRDLRGLAEMSGAGRSLEETQDAARPRREDARTAERPERRPAP